MLRRSSSSSSSSSFSIDPWKYYIFLSFSGEDTRKNFTDHLYDALRRHSFVTFRDNNNLKRGEYIAPGLLKGIRESWGSIIVFSKRYAFSGSCLEELAEIVKQREERGHYLLPVFYHIDPSDLRHQTNSVFEAFAKHEERYMDNKEKIQRWRNALTKAADTARYDLKDQYESEFIKTIIEDITPKLLESRLHWKELHSKLNTRQDDVRIIGICGTSDVCKSAIAGVVYTQMSPFFEAKSFLTNVGHVSRNNGLVSLHKLLLSQISSEETFDFSDIHEGSEIINKKLPQKKVLIVMHDVDDLQQLKCMVGKKEWFGLGSKIIVTTENEQLLRSFGVDDICELTTTNAKRTVKFHNDSIVDNRVRIGQATNLIGEAPRICMEKIWDYLMNDGIGKIAVWGMGGVGKTTIMKVIYDLLLEENEKFVIWITVSKEIDIFKLQNKIAYALEVQFHEDEDVTIRAWKIYQTLARKGKYVLILDDLWDKLSLEEVGIPEPINGSRLLVTSRLSEVCCYLKCQVIEMSILSKADSWGLFLENVGQDVLNHSDDLLNIVKSVAGECGGLPLALVSIAKSMSGERELSTWRSALDELSRCVKSVNDLDEKVFQRLKFSYDRLEDEKVKHCFLCCALYPEDFDILINELIQLWIAERLVEEMGSLQEQIDRGRTILKKLKNCCLIEKCKENLFHLKSADHCVKLHDVVRDMALRIKRSQFLVRASMQLKVIPDEEEWQKDLKKVSFMYNRKLRIPSQMSPPKCPKLRTLLLSNCSIRSIPECFFEQMHRLKNLDLSCNPIKRLPNSISDLKTLTALLLHGCGDLENVPSFSKLRALKKLDLGFTNINGIGILNGMERLVNLKYLDCIPKRTRESTGGFVRGKEIGGLRKLEFLKVRLYDMNELNSYIEALHAPIKKLHFFEISVGQACSYKLYDKLIDLRGCNIFCTNGIKLLSDVENLNIVNCFVVLCKEKPFFSWFILVPHDTFSSLVRLEIVCCKNIKKVFSSNWVLQKNLQILEEFCVEACEDIEEIIASESEMGEEAIGAMKLNLPKLGDFQLTDLPELKSICSANGVIFCDSSVRIFIDNCPKLKRIPVNLPLRDNGQAYSLPSLTTTFENRMTWCLSYFNNCTDGLKVPSNVGELDIYNCIVDLSEEEAFFSRFITVPHKTFSSLCEIKISSCKNIKKLFWSNCVLNTNLQNLRYFCVHFCEDIEEIIASESELEEEGISSIKLTLPKLRELSLRNLPKLKTIYGAKGVIVCDSIVCIGIINCLELKRIPLILPALILPPHGDGQTYPLPSLSRILIDPKEQWKSIELDQPNDKSLLEPYVTDQH